MAVGEGAASFVFPQQKHRDLVLFFAGFDDASGLGLFLGDGGSQISLKAGVVDLDQSALSEEWKQNLFRQEAVKPASGSEAELMKKLKSGDIDFVVKIEKGFEKAYQTKQSAKKVLI